MQRLQLNNLLSRVKTRFFVGLFGGLSLPFSETLRSLLYRFILGSIGSGVRIKAGVEFNDARLVYLEDGVVLSKGVYIDSREDSVVRLGKQASLDRDVRLLTSDGGCRIILGPKVRLDRGVDMRVKRGGCTELGERTYVGPYACFSGSGSIKVGKNCLIASHCSIYAHNHAFADATIPIRDQGFTCKGITIEDDVWLGTGVRVVDGVTIGEGSVVGAGAVVTKSIPPYSIAVGVPAKVIGKRGEKQTQAQVEATMATISMS